MTELSASDLTYLPSEINSLYIGPAFQSPTVDVVQSLPKGLQQLDLDLTAMDSSPEEDAHDDHVMRLLFERAKALESLSLRVHGCTGVRAVAQNLTRAVNLKMLDFRSNHMGDDGVKVLCKAILAADYVQGFSPIEHLILTWNDVTDVGVYHLCQVLRSPGCSLKHLDLSCNHGITDQGFSLICEALRQNTSLERLAMFCCQRINNPSPLKELLVEDESPSTLASSGTKVYNYTLKYVDIGATPARYHLHDMEQINFGLALNRANRLRLRCQRDNFFWILKSNLEDDPMTDIASGRSTVQWWRPAHELVYQENPLEDLSVSFHLLRQTSAFWSKTSTVDEDAMECD